MNTWKVLIVDDQPSWAEIARDHVATWLNRSRSGMAYSRHVQHPDSAEVIIVHAHSHADAKDKLKEMFFHIALVDLVIPVTDKAGSRRTDDGIEVLKTLASIRPTCRRVLMTANYTEEKLRLDILGAFKPSNRLAEELIIKSDFAITVDWLLTDCGRHWLGAPIHVIGLDHVVTELRNRPGITWGSEVASTDPAGSQQIQIPAYPSADEVDFLVSRVFGQGSPMWRTPEWQSGETEYEKSVRELYERLAVPTSEDVQCVKLNPVGTGQSSSLVLFATPQLGNGQTGVNCIVKLGPVDEIREEYRRFCRFVRFRKGSERRVELLGYEEGDSLGALCLSNAAKNTAASPRSLEKLFQDCDSRALKCLNLLHDPDRQDWYSMAGEPKDLCKYWDESYPWKKRSDQPLLVRNFISEDEKRNGDINKISVPESILSLAPFQKSWPTCIVHGDMHGGNILVAADGRPILIDYRNVGIGPRCMDFAALESSVRLSAPIEEGPRTGVDIDDWLALEQAILSKTWRDEPRGRVPTQVYWQQVSIRLGALAKANFSKTVSGKVPNELTAEEYCAACILWGLRIFSNRSFTDIQRRRLAIWLTALHQFIV